MKNSTPLMALLASALLMSAAYAEDLEPASPPEGADREVWSDEDFPRRERERRGMGGERGQMSEGMKGGMMKGGPMGMQQPSVVATSDGGVVVFMGGKLVKYDAQLNRIGEAELKKAPPRDEERPRRRSPESDAPQAEEVPTPQFAPADAPDEAAPSEN